MADAPRRPILRLKNPPPAKPQPVGPEPAWVRPPKAEPVPTGPVWKCKPCGTRVDLPTDADADPETVIRCSGCNARLGRLGQFLSDPPGAVRARLVE